MDMNNFHELEMLAKQHQERLREQAEHHRRLKLSRVGKTKQPLFRKFLRVRQKQRIWQPIVIPRPALKD